MESLAPGERLCYPTFGEAGTGNGLRVLHLELTGSNPAVAEDLYHLATPHWRIPVQSTEDWCSHGNCPHHGTRHPCWPPLYGRPGNRPWRLCCPLPAGGDLLRPVGVEACTAADCAIPIPWFNSSQKLQITPSVCPACLSARPVLAPLRQTSGYQVTLRVLNCVRVPCLGTSRRCCIFRYGGVKSLL